MKNKSWSAIRKKLEEELICDSLKGHIQFFMTRYRKVHDQEGRVAVRLDGKEIFKTDYFKYEEARYCCRKQIQEDLSISKANDKVELLVFSNGCFDHWSFYEAFSLYENQDIKLSQNSDNAIVLFFSILDRRTGKRTLTKMKEKIQGYPEWVRMFLSIRMQYEGSDNQ